jgi:CDP-diacylglycerol--glycerol-3-phosphate 3-phosphatidyltransferase
MDCTRAGVRMPLESRVDVACSSVVVCVFVVAGVAMRRSWAARGARADELPERLRAMALPVISWSVLRTLEPVAALAVKLGVTANAVTMSSLLAGVAVGATLATGHLGVAGALFVLAASGDALDGLVARASHTESPSGALFDASVDRYQEFLAFAGLAIHFRSSRWLLSLTLLALAGSFMVSYGSAQAEARHVAVPPGVMRRPERAACLALGLVLGPLLGLVLSQRALGLGDDVHARDAPVILAMSVIAVAANMSAVHRIRSVARALTPATLARRPRPTHGHVASSRAG